MTIYENFMLKQYGEYIYARICCKIATALNEKHKSNKCKPDFVISKGIEFTTKSKVCLEMYDKEIEACRAYIQEMEDEHLTDKELDEDWDEDDDIDDIWDEFERLRNDLNAMDHESPSPLKAKIVKPKFHS
jgi:DNA mismatch repair ATPase MutL